MTNRNLAKVDELMRDEALRLRAGVDQERQRLRDALLRAAREVTTAGDRAAADVVSTAIDVGQGFLERDELARAERVELGARVAHDRVRAAAQRLADEIRAMEGSLVGPLTSVARATTGEGLPALRRIFLEGEGTDPWVDTVRINAREQVDASLARIRRATTRGVETIEAGVRELPRAVQAAAERSIRPGLQALGQEASIPRRRWWASVLLALATGLALLLVVASTLVAYAVGLGVAGALFGAIVLSGTYAPPVGAGFVAAAIGTLLSAAITDLLFNVLGDWRDGRDDGLLGAAVPVRGSGRLPRALDVGPVLDALHLTPPRALDETPAPAAYAPFDVTTTAPGGLDSGLVDPGAHRSTREQLHAEVVHDVTTDEEGR